MKKITSHDQTDPILLIILISLLLHIIIAALFLSIKTYQQDQKDLKQFDNNNNYQAFLMPDEPQKTHQQPTSKLQEEEPLTPPITINQEVLTLIPGRQQDVPENKVVDPENENDIEEILNKTPNKSQHHTMPEKKELAKTPQDLPKSNSEKQDIYIQNDDTITASRKKEESLNEFLPADLIINDDPRNFVPKRKRSLQKLDLDFDNRLANFGNNKNVWRQGNMTATADAKTIKEAQFISRFGDIILNSINTHPNRMENNHLRNKILKASVTTDRIGRLLNINIITSSGHPLIDKMISESIETAGLYPNLPDSIVGSSYTMIWTIRVNTIY